MSVTRPTTLAGLVKLRLSGVAFLVVIAALVGLTVALYQKTFTPTVNVTLQADRAGNQLSAPTDVKLRGLIVGEARSVTSTGDGAVIKLALSPDMVGLIPANVQAQLLPKTLFGEKYIALVLPPDPSVRHLAAGDVIGQDRSSTARETAKLVDDLLPVLQTLKPEQLSLTLNALSSALRDRGDKIGANFARVDDYLAAFNPALPTLQQNFRGVADLSDTLERARPDLLAVVDNLSFTSRSLVDQKGQLAAFLSSTAGFNDSLTSLLGDNETRLVTLAADSLPPLQVYERYAGEAPCFLKGLTAFNARSEKSFGGGVPGLHITLSQVKDQGAYQPGRQPQFLDDRGARCYGLPSPVTPAPDIKFQDGYSNGQPSTSQGGAAPASQDPALALAAPVSQQLLLNSVAGPVMGLPADQVPDLVTLLFGPMARGTVAGVA